MWPSSFKSRFSGFKSRKTIFLPGWENHQRQTGKKLKLWWLHRIIYYYLDIYKHPRLRGFQPPTVWGIFWMKAWTFFSPCLWTSPTKHGPSGYANDWKPQQRQQCRTWHGSLCQKDPSCCRWPWHSTMKVLGKILVRSLLQSIWELPRAPHSSPLSSQAPNFWSKRHKALHPAPAPVTNRDALGLPTSREGFTTVPRSGLLESNQTMRPGKKKNTFPLNLYRTEPWKLIWSLNMLPWKDKLIWKLFAFWVLHFWGVEGGKDILQSN